MDPNWIKVETMIIARSHSQMLNMARFLAAEFGPLIADVTIRLIIGNKNKFFVLVILKWMRRKRKEKKRKENRWVKWLTSEGGD